MHSQFVNILVFCFDEPKKRVLNDRSEKFRSHVY